MEIEIKIDSSCVEPRVIVLTAAVTQDVQELVRKLSQDPPQVISGTREERVEVLEPADLVRIYSSGGKVLAVTSRGEYRLHLRLYEMEQRLNGDQFVRISNSEIINLKKVDHFDLSFTGTICVLLADGTRTFVSRRYVAKIKKLLGL